MAIWTAIALAFAASTHGLYSVKGTPIGWGLPLFWSFTEWYIWAALSPALFWLARRFPISPTTWGRNLVVHLVAAALAAVIHETGFALLERATGLAPTPVPPLQQSILLYVTKRAAFDLMVYSAIVAVAHALALYRRYLDRERMTLQLETKLARAQLEQLKIQLQPHFLFNTLNTISALLHRDAEAADRVLSRLGDLLRLSLQHSGRQEVMLRQELEFVERYLEIQQTRFQDRLTVRYDADPEALDALVPTLVLQPLVENAVRHAIEPRAGPGHLDIRVRKHDARLSLQVADDGPGLGAAGLSGSGIGLANTRARLEQLYGKEHSFTLANGPSGGLVVTLEIPYRVGNLPTPVAPLHA